MSPISLIFLICNFSIFFFFIFLFLMEVYQRSNNNWGSKRRDKEGNNKKPKKVSQLSDRLSKKRAGGRSDDSFLVPQVQLIEDPSRLEKLVQLLQHEFEIVDKNQRTRIVVTLEAFLKRLQWILRVNGVRLAPEGVRLAGSAASCIISPNSSILFEDEVVVCDIDINIYVEQQRDPSSSFFKILQCEEECISTLVFEQTGLEYQNKTICDLFFLEMLKVESPGETWSLISVGNNITNINIDIKFIQQSKRCWVFSTDSFEILLDPIFPSPLKECENKLMFESMYALTMGDLRQALNHLKSGYLKSKRPSEIKRGIFRLCLELSKGREFETEEEEKFIRNTFCKQFFEDFKGKPQLFRSTLEKFLSKQIGRAHV